MAECGIDPASTRLGVVGAAGNIGSTLVRVLADRFTRLKLVGRKANLARVSAPLRRSTRMPGTAWPTAGASAGGIAGALAETGVPQPILSPSNGAAVPGAIGVRACSALIERYGTDPLIAITDGIEDSHHCPVIITASNSTEPIFRKNNVGPGLKLLDRSVLMDVDPEVLTARPDVRAIRAAWRAVRRGALHGAKCRAAGGPPSRLHGRDRDPRACPRQAVTR